MPVLLSLYTRNGCHLCEDMERDLPGFATELDFTTEIIPIDNNAGLEQLYGSRVPVLAIGDEVICEYFLDKASLAQAITRETLNKS